jgi:hypothetical protein
MTDLALREALGAYASGLDAEMRLLEQLHALADDRDRHAPGAPVAELQASADRRDDLIAQLLRLEQTLKPLRQTIAAQRKHAARFPEFPAVADRHRTAAELVARILTADEHTLAALRDAEAARRFAAQAIETGGQTLAAYRRVVSPAPGSAALIDEHG